MTGAVTAAALASLSFVLAVVGVSLLLDEAKHRSRIMSRIRSISGSEILLEDARDQQAELLLRAMNAVGRAVLASKILPTKMVADLGASLVAAGYRARSALPIFVGAKVLFVTVLPALAWLAMHATGNEWPPRSLVCGAAAIMGLLGPDYVVRKLRKTYLTQVEKGLGDALDMLIICAEAGLPIEAGIDRVAIDMRVGNRPLAAEFELVAHEMKILPDRRTALTNAGARTGIEGLVRLGATLSQSIQYGTPLAQALRTLALESRTLLLNRFEASAARLPVILTLPMVVFILPVVFIVVGCPAVVQALLAFKH